MLTKEHKESLKERVRALKKTQDMIEDELKIIAYMVENNTDKAPDKIDSYPFKRILRNKLNIVI